MRVLRCGEDGLLVEPRDASSILGVAQALRGLEGVVEVVPAARTVLLRTDRGVEWLRARIDEMGELGTAVPHADVGVERIDLEVRYDGADLVDTATELGLTPDALVRAHAAADYIVAFCGFAPGFAYLTGLDPRLHASRLAEPRTRVPSGSVGIAGEFTGVYPRESPGGWRLLGRTDAELWDAAREPPALLAPGTRVRFRPVP